MVAHIFVGPVNGNVISKVIVISDWNSNGLNQSLIRTCVEGIPIFGEGGGEVAVVDEAGEVVVDVGAEAREDALEVGEEVAVDRVLYLGQIVCTRILEADVKPTLVALFWHYSLNSWTMTPHWRPRLILQRLPLCSS